MLSSIGSRVRPQGSNCLRSPPAEGRSSIDQEPPVAGSRGRLLSRPQCLLSRMHGRRHARTRDSLLSIVRENVPCCLSGQPQNIATVRLTQAIYFQYFIHEIMKDDTLIVRGVVRQHPSPCDCLSNRLRSLPRIFKSPQPKQLRAFLLSSIRHPIPRGASHAFVSDYHFGDVSDFWTNLVDSNLDSTAFPTGADCPCRRRRHICDLPDLLAIAYGRWIGSPLPLLVQYRTEFESHPIVGEDVRGHPKAIGAL